MKHNPEKQLTISDKAKIYEAKLIKSLEQNDIYKQSTKTNIVTDIKKADRYQLKEALEEAMLRPPNDAVKINHGTPMKNVYKPIKTRSKEQLTMDCFKLTEELEKEIALAGMYEKAAALVDVVKERLKKLDNQLTSRVAEKAAKEQQLSQLIKEKVILQNKRYGKAEQLETTENSLQEIKNVLFEAKIEENSFEFYCN